MSISFQGENENVVVKLSFYQIFSERFEFILHRCHILLLFVSKFKVCAESLWPHHLSADNAASGLKLFVASGLELLVIPN